MFWIKRLHLFGSASFEPLRLSVKVLSSGGAGLPFRAALGLLSLPSGSLLSVSHGVCSELCCLLVSISKPKPLIKSIVRHYVMGNYNVNHQNLK